MTTDIQTGRIDGGGVASPPVRALVFEDSVYRACGGALTTDRAFLFYVTHLAAEGLDLTMLGRVHPDASRSHYDVPPSVEVLALPYYPSLMHRAAVPALVRSLRQSWRALADADVAWLMGPHPFSYALAVQARLQGVPVVLGVRQDLPRYMRERHPDRPWAHRAADLLEAAWLRAARRSAVVAVGPELTRNYAGAAKLLPLDISLVPTAELDRDREPVPFDGELRLLSVGRLEQEKNPLLLADVLARLRAQDPRWRLLVCGEGSMEPELRARLSELGVAEHAELLGYVPVDQGLLDLYRSSHVFLHVSWTEGLPQVLFEAWSGGLPVVATDVGGVAEAAGDAALLIPPGDADRAVEAVRSLAGDEALRSRLVRAGTARLAEGSMDVGIGRLAAFLREVAVTPRASRRRKVG